MRVRYIRNASKVALFAVIAIASASIDVPDTPPCERSCFLFSVYPLIYAVTAAFSMDALKQSERVIS